MGFPIQTHDSRIVEVTSEHKGTNIDELTDDLHGIDGMYTLILTFFLLCVMRIAYLYIFIVNHMDI